MREQLLEHLTALRSPDGAASSKPLSMEVLRHEGEHILDGVLWDDRGRWWWVADGVPRILPSAMYRNAAFEERYGQDLKRLGLAIPAATRATGRLGKVQARTIDRFGTEWLMFRDWGYHKESPGDPLEFQGGLWANTLGAFRSKTFLDGRLNGLLALDAGCGNGRFTAAAIAGGAKEVIAVDIGWGVDAAFEHHRQDPRIHVVQASLFDLPVRRVDAAFSIGVLMHTGDAAAAFAEISRVVAPGGLFAVRMYHRGNVAYELVDRAIRTVSTRLSKPAQERMARAMARLGARISAADRQRPGRRMRVYQVFRNWSTVHHNLDWWSAPVASHHTAPEVAAWGQAAGLEVVKSDLSCSRASYGFWDWPEALTILFSRPAQAGSVPMHQVPAASAA